MDKITDAIAALPPDTDYFSLEFFPPKTTMGFANLRDRLGRMARALRPLFVNVTWGAGGSTAAQSLELADLCRRELGLTTCLHLTCTNMSKALIDAALEEAKVLGIRNILALRGDPPRRAEYGPEEEEEDAAVSGGGEGEGEGEGDFVRAIDLVRYIRRVHGDYFCIGVAAYPEGHADESHPRGQSLEHDLQFLVDKVQAGADFVMTQLFFDIRAYDRFETTLRAHASGAFKTLPIIPGLMPIQSYQMIKRTTKLSHARIPDALLARLDAVKADDEKVKTVGVDILCELVEQVREIKNRTSGRGPRGFHFYTLNLEKAVSFIVERTKLIPRAAGYESAVADARPVPEVAVKDNRVIISRCDPEYEASAHDASIPAELINTRAHPLPVGEGEGALGRKATWDDFPNGRWGDARSPAYGQIDGYGVSLHVTAAQALRLWGTPRTPADISGLFIRHLEGQLSAIPWSEEGFNEETTAIREPLVRLNSKGWWTLASQPAVNGLRSSDPTYGWGPDNGFVFQKAFVEFFLPAADWKALETRLRTPEVRDSVCFFAADAAGDFASSDPTAKSTPREPSTNPVTWGVFPGKEIVTPTIIEEVSFRAWTEEAFSIWREWAKVYRKGSESARLLEASREGVWLVNIIHHDFPDKGALWRLLLE
ncbi:hypothetical protein P8C59_006098 [Phyllachora maydis]|uniref:MTHFR SAM-binding regulatory domain-containing protein n=1 Tax=Phyllachora maydis TaxID=1825666 RepID=A0AAD9I5U5_9PEZI|nr:hypothetical protein P8C59_006098 [Phyllachora maydis]